MADADEVLKEAGRFFSKLGSKLKQTSKQVTGLGRGSVRVELERTRVAPGDAIKGKLVLAFDEPVDAKRLVVTLRANQRIVELRRTDGGRTPATTKSELFHFDKELGAAKSYESGTIAFELDVPPDALELRPSAGEHPIAEAVRSIASALTPTAGPIEWSVRAWLDVPWGRDLSHSVDVVIAR